MQSWQTPSALGHVECLLRSYAHWTGRDLLDENGVSCPPGPRQQMCRAEAVFHLPCVVVAHGPGADPVFVYANATALELWELDNERFLQLPSRRSAEPSEGALRSRWLATAAAQGYVTGCSGVRISSTGRRFRIEDVTIWNCIDAGGLPVGQGATYRSWTYL